MTIPPIDTARLLRRAMRLLDEARDALTRPRPPEPKRPPTDRRQPPEVW